MMERKEVYETLEKIEGGEAVKNAVKSLLYGLDQDVKRYRENSESLDSKLKELGEEMGTLKGQLEESNNNGVQKTELEKLVADMNKKLTAVETELGTVRDERDTVKKQNEQQTAERKQTELEKYFYNSVSESFGAVGAGDAVAVSLAKLGYSEEGEMQYSGVTGDSAIEQFKADNARFVENKGTGTSGQNGVNTGDVNPFMAEMLAD